MTQIPPTTGNVPPGYSPPSAFPSGDFWNLLSLAEQFANSVGWRYMPTEAELEAALSAGAANWDQLQTFSYFAQQTGVDLSKMPWAAQGMTVTQYNQQFGNLQDTLYGLTGQDTFAAAGLGAIQQQALEQGWSPQRITDYILQNPQLKAQYGYLAFGYNYTSFQAYKAQNADSLRSRFGHGFTDQNAIQNLSDPLAQFHAQGSAFGQQAPFVASQAAPAQGRQSSIR